MIFGTGTSLRVQISEDVEPNFYQLEKDNTQLCLATGFSRRKKLNETYPFNETEATFIDRENTDPETKGLYSQVAFMKPGDKEEYCQETIGGFVETLQPDPVVNLVSLTVLGLRILFVKTVAINILLTLRLFISR
ncbi:hypothetical protein NL108_018588 [Boleophthalmus pectinirostris]|nr:hypothetical protein NL108_018588 [Boleophthalmus pectinirostris]